MTPVTILLLFRRFNCNDGVASYCEALVKGLAARGDRVVIVSGPVTQLFGSSIRYDAISQHTVDWIVLGGFNAKRPSLTHIRRILATIRDHAVDVISPQGLSMLQVAAVLSQLSGRQVVANYHPRMSGRTADQVATRISFVASLKQRLILTCFMPSIMIAISSEVRTYFETACKLNPARIALIPHGVDISHFRPAPALERDEARASFGIPPDSLVCVLSGRMNFNKGHDILIDAVRRLRETAPALNIICLFPGGGDQAPQIKSYALHDAADATAFRFLGFVDFARLREVYWAADVAVMPSRFEGFGLAMAEAMSCGCVPVRTPGGGWQEQIIEGVNGFIIPFNDPQALADRLLELAGPSRRAAMREKAIAHAQINFSGEKMIAETAALYRRAASTKPSFPRKRESS